MKIQTLILILLIFGGHAYENIYPKREVKKGTFDSMEIIDWQESGMVKTVYLKDKEFFRDYEW